MILSHAACTRMPEKQKPMISDVLMQSATSFSDLFADIRTQVLPGLEERMANKLSRTCASIVLSAEMENLRGTSLMKNSRGLFLPACNPQASRSVNCTGKLFLRPGWMES